MNQRVMMFAAIVLAVIAIVLAGYSFGEMRSLSNAVETHSMQIAAVEQAQAEPAPDDGLAESLAVLEDQLNQLAAQVGELTERVNQIAEAAGGVTDEPAPQE